MPSSPFPIPTPLTRIDTWPAAKASAAVFTRDAVRARYGNTQQVFALASLTKPLAAIVTMVAVEEGTVDLDDPAGPEGSTMRHLLSHASGLNLEGTPLTLADPGERRIYSNMGFDTMADHVTERSGMSFNDYVRAALVEPLGLAATEVQGSCAYSYRSCVADVVTVIQAVVSHRLLAPETVMEMTTPTFPELAGVLPGYGRQDPNPWGLGVEIRGRKSPHWTGTTNSEGTWGHFGQSGTFVWWDPKYEIGVVVLTDHDFGDWAQKAWPALSDEIVRTVRV